jgi:uncharacterized protein (TIGR03435 family)
MSGPLIPAIVGLLIPACGIFAQSAPTRPAFEAFEVATIKPVDPNSPGRYIRMQSAHRFYAKNHTVKRLVGAAYNLNPRMISGGPGWIDSDQYDVVAATPGEVQPSQDEQMAMLRNLLADRFKLTFHRQQETLPVYALTIAKTGSRVKESTGLPDALPELISVVYPDPAGVHLKMPARNATMAQFASILQRAILDRPVVDQTGLPGKYDFNLEWTPDESQFDGALNRGTNTDGSAKPGLFAALQQQLGLKLEATRGPVDLLVIDRVERPSEN